MGEVVVCDMDGTITRKDVSVLLLEKFASGKWRQMEEFYHTGQWSLKQTALEEFKLLNWILIFQRSWAYARRKA